MEVTSELLDHKRNISDFQADDLINNVVAEGKAGLLYKAASLPVELLKDHFSVEDEIGRFLFRVREKPAWLDKHKLQRAADFYYQYALEIMMLLGAVSLPTCYAATPGNKVLYLSEKIRKNTGKRLLETASFVILVTGKDAFKAEGPGYIAVQQVRLIHALARYHILNSGQWDASWGFPANEEDMIGTNLAFSYTVLKALRDSGFPLNEEDLEAYLHLWKWVGYLMGIEDSLLTDRMEAAGKLDQLIRERHFRKNREGELLTRSLIDHFREALPKGLGFFVESQIRFLVGQDVGDMLGLKYSRLDHLMVKSVSCFMKFYNHIVPHKSTFDKMMQDHKRLKKMYLS